MARLKSLVIKREPGSLMHQVLAAAMLMESPFRCELWSVLKVITGRAPADQLNPR